MAIRSTQLRRRVGRDAGGRLRNDDDRRFHRPESGFATTIRQLLAGASQRSDLDRWGEFTDLPLPDLLAPSITNGPDRARLLDLLDLAFLGRASAGETDEALNDLAIGASRWDSAHFADDLFLGDLVRRVFSLELNGVTVPMHSRFLKRVLANPPVDPDHIRYRQAILRELEERPALAGATENLARSIYDLLALLRASRDDARLEPVRFRLDVLRAFFKVVVLMTEGFTSAESGLHRLCDVGAKIRSSRAFGRMEALLDHDAAMAHLDLEVVIGANGRLRHLEIRKLAECRGNPFFRRPIRRWWDRLRVFYHRYGLGADELVDRLVMGVYQDVAPAMVRVVQTLCHLEVYLAARGMAADARARGLSVCLPKIEHGADLAFDELFNPLLMAITEHPVPTDLEIDVAASVTLVTGPNSGGKTRLLQAIGLAQVLGQSGLYAPCRSARMPVVSGLFASIIEIDRADQAEGRLGSEMVRLGTLFEHAPPNSLILLDELCSGTNPSEAVEIIELVLRMLQRIDPVAFVTTHFLDFAQRLESESTMEALRFLQAEVDPDQGPTYRFLPGVASTSLAVGTAHRLGVTFEELEKKIARRALENRDDGEPR
jgi:DNA mismatch repair protein MutS2